MEDLISPIIPINDAHLILGLEPLETIRNLRYISEQTVVILNTHRLYPKNVIIGSEKEKKYPSIADVIDILDQFARRTISMDFNELSKVKFNNPIYSNIIILGVGARAYRDIFYRDLMINVLKNFFRDSKNNLEAFTLGYNLISDS